MDPTGEFFTRLGQRGHEPLLEDISGTIRFDLEGEHGVDRWFLEISQGDLCVSRDERESDCVIRMGRGLFDRLVTGDERQYPAWVRTELRAEGEPRLAYLFQRLLPGPPGARHPREFARERRRRA
ncbi:SCP2 sterol-binding domain-containing protein [Rugosimonospora africana]|uniref:SCP2 domain-containing protein n=1 Tax=Rugosimonospora africana TaxID=556532 RepID=A0A8J3R4S0_9ACTN|nr:SCP2 sterol-binding domain-containing protein [Rugosimonospora africana]GIH21668.1 hypothetical protein Raf01_98400 [Rugosimonospora africana]